MDLDIRYVAGIFDGEGWITINVMPITSMGSGHRYTKDYVRYQLFVGIGMNHYPLVERIHRQFNGLLHRNDSAHRRDPKNRVNYQWRLSSSKAAEFLEKIEPILIVKKEEAQLAIEFQKHMRAHTSDFKYRKHLRPELYAYRQDIVERIRALKKRSYNVPNGSDPELPLALSRKQS